MLGILVFSIFFFFQAEDGIRDDLVTGVQTCALPIFGCVFSSNRRIEDANRKNDRRGLSLRSYFWRHLWRNLHQPSRHGGLTDRAAVMDRDFGTLQCSRQARINVETLYAVLDEERSALWC